MAGKGARRAVASVAVASLIAVGAAQASAGASGHPALPSSSTTTTIVTANTTAGVAPSESPTSDTSVPTFGPSTSFALDQSWMQTALSARQARLSMLAGNIGSSSTLRSGDHDALQALVSSAQSTCSQLQSAVSSATTTAQLRSDAAVMINSLHVFAILTPQVELTVDVDAFAAAAGKLEALEPELNTAIAAAHANSRKLARLQALEQELAAAASAASNLVAPLPGQLVALSDADLPAANPVLASAQSADRSARIELNDAGSDLRSLLSLLAETGVNSHVRIKLKRDLRATTAAIAFSAS